MFKKLAVQKTSTELLTVVITITAIITMATTTSLSAASPAFAKKNCNEDNTICSGGSGCDPAGCQGGTSPSDLPGGGGGRTIQSEPPDQNVITNNGGRGLNDGDSVGGFGFRLECDAECNKQVGGSGLHPKALVEIQVIKNNQSHLKA
jgi:hypothetical protein